MISQMILSKLRERLPEYTIGTDENHKSLLVGNQPIHVFDLYPVGIFEQFHIVAEALQSEVIGKLVQRIQETVKATPFMEPAKEEIVAPVQENEPVKAETVVEAPAPEPVVETPAEVEAPVVEEPKAEEPVVEAPASKKGKKA